MVDTFTLGSYFWAWGRPVGITHNGKIKHICKCLQNQNYNDAGLESCGRNGRPVFLNRMTLARNFNSAGTCMDLLEKKLISTVTFCNAYFLFGITPDNYQVN